MRTCLLFLLSCVALFSCGRYPCGKASASISLIGFTNAESDTVILRRYDKATAFTSLRDTVLLTKTNAGFQRDNDTLHILRITGNQYDITTDYDFEVVVPKASRRFRLTELLEEQQYGKKGGTKEYCIDGIISYRLDGQLVMNNGFTLLYLTR